ncbi:amidohydrolase [Brevundimonas subvibrioides]|uniref:Amidohydrolase n=1 Tax=Brevundimonas subvibrioides (strain ATCC 15264 / DSM 4735 / LMG 14903 / NBRC 16000 / CB 81) TaxID=633149 RepID=D9QL90_BRESC|nr:amidohydrolase [Brevundimonas subvibrioides]ADK99945.1 amidohydrolase [Brevundimonas subvibrioides ATCC 15264]
MIRPALLAALLTLAASPALAQTGPVSAAEVAAAAEGVNAEVVAWRRDLHQHPELGLAETRTAAFVAERLKAMGIEVREGVGRTGVVGVLRGTGTGPQRVVALRADMDALPVLEATGLPFASTATGTYQGATVPVAHACGHDAHVAMLLGAAEVLSGMKDRFSGTIVFLFQPAEEGVPPGEPLGGARLMIEAGALKDPKVEAIFGLHVVPGVPGTIFYRPQGFMAASDRVDIVLHGRQTHGAWPWRGVDVIAVTANVIQTINTLTARTVDPTTTPTVFTIATIDAGVRYNIIPEEATLAGTLRTFDIAQRDALVARAEAAVDHVAEAYGATADFSVRQNAALVFNDETLSAWLAPVLTEAAGEGKVNPASPPTTVAEDFSYFQGEIPGVFYHLGATPDGVDPATAAPNHSPQFDVNEAVLPVGVRAHVLSALRFLERS